jgi:hypothetical protein
MRAPYSLLRYVYETSATEFALSRLTRYELLWLRDSLLVWHTAGVAVTALTTVPQCHLHPHRRSFAAKQSLRQKILDR